jgi:ribosomal protein S18 acetylase RimI-like enzyme
VSVQARGAALIREFDARRDWAEFIALNYQTFKDSIPRDEPITEEEFRRQHQWIIEHFAPADTRRGRVFVAEVEGKYAGHVWVGSQSDFFTRRSGPWIFDLSVKPQYRRRGLAQALHQKAERWVKSQGFAAIGLQVMAHNEAAAALYRKLGYNARAISMKKGVS